VKRWIWRIVLGLLVAGFVGGAIYAGVSGAVTPSSIRAWLDSLGTAAPPMFVGAFVLGALFGLPGIVFVVGGRLAFGPQLGFVVGYAGGVIACATPFLIARTIRKQAIDPSWRPKNKHVARIFRLLETRPLVGVVGLRLLLWFNPPLSYALAVSPVPTPHYLAGCAIALAPVVAVAMIATGWFL
jgi:uncharacterized membrane protein YdjX (TVP38/TMEM64 family)